MSVARQRRSYVPTLRLGGLWKPSDARFRREIDRFRWISMDFRWIFDRFSMKMLTFEARFYDLARRLLARFRTTRAPGPGDVAHGAAAAGA